ncbi:MAG TPA: hypothetical protein VEY67_11535, partial [Candidatus Dormibacteraeota bacterium]|nr:hypothetical protein [Candidatus Dormibacteraeota bacterium]
MFDIIGRRNWFFAFSLAIVIPGLLFILLTPLTGDKEGLKFSIDYTGGTRWSIKFDDANVTSDQVQAVFVANGLPDTSVVKQANGYLDIRTQPVGLNPAPSPSAVPSPNPTASASASGSAGASASPGASSSASPSGSP